MNRLFFLVVALTSLLAAREPLAQRVAHTDPAQYRVAKGVHGGAGEMRFMGLLDGHALDTNLLFVHRGVLQPKGGIGHHFHNQCEEMFVILDGEAQFTIDGRTSTLKGPAGAPCRMGHSHAIYNATDRPVEWMNINVSSVKGKYDAFDLGDPRVDVSLDPVPVFITMRLWRSLLPPGGTVKQRRALDSAVFAGPWAYTDHVLVEAGAATIPHRHQEVAEVYYVMSGEGRIRVGDETAAIRSGDAIPIQLSETHSVETGVGQPLELLVVGVSRDGKKVDVEEVKR
jgi:mannose-6-phosphate isomerase-like protein (cupin superfamily)